MTSNLATAYSTVRSTDGTRISYRSLGRGPGVVVLHGSMQSAQSHLQLANALAGDFTVHLPDRRGHGESGPPGAAYRMDREVEDLEAVLAETGARNVFGVSSSGLIALQTARRSSAVVKAAVYEPALLDRSVDWLSRYDREMARGKVAAALVTSMLGLRLGPAALRFMPRPLLTVLTEQMMKAEDRKAGPGDLTMRSLAPTLHCEGVLLAEMTGALPSFSEVRADVLLLGGSKGLAWLRPALDGLEQVLPRVRRVEFDGLDHGGAADVTPANRNGKPCVVAETLRGFFC